MKLEKSIFRQYQKASKEVGGYLKLKLNPPREIEGQYKQALSLLRDHLDENGIKMPIPLYPYDRNDTNTHKFVLIGPLGRRALNSHYLYKKEWEFNRNTIEV